MSVPALQRSGPGARPDPAGGSPRAGGRLRHLPARALPVALALVLAMLPLGCGRRAAPDSGTSVDGSDAELSGTVFLAVGVNEEDTLGPELRQEMLSRLSRLTQAFGVLHPRVRIQLQFFREERLDQELSHRNRTGLGPDLLLVNGSTALELVRQKLARPVHFPAEVTDQVDSGSLRRLTVVGGRTAGLPLLLVPELACFDRRHLASSPATVEELLQRSARSLRVGLPVDMLNLAWTFGPLGAIDTFTRLSAGNEPTAADRASLTSWLVWLRSAQLQRGVSFHPDNEALLDGLAGGKLDWISCRSTHLNRLRDRLGPRLGVAPLPGGPGGPATPITRERVLAFGLNSSPGQRRAAEALARFTINPLVQRTFTVGTQEVLPVNRTLRPPLESTEVLRALVASNQDSLRSGRLVLLLLGASAPVERDLRRILSRFLYGELDPEEGAGQIVKALQRREGP